MIRFVKMAIFSEVQWLFSIRKAADLIVKVHTIGFVGLPFVFTSHGGWRTDAGRQVTGEVQMPKSKCQMKSKCLKAKRKGGINTATVAVLCRVYGEVLRNLTCGT